MSLANSNSSMATPESLLAAASKAHLYNARILGAGPAGLSSALALSRVTGAHTILTQDDVHPAEIRQLGRRDVEKYGLTRFVEKGLVDVIECESKGSVVCSKGGSR